jgi:hypothetical protein
VRNGGPITLENTMVQVDDARGITFPKGNALTIPTLRPFESTTVRITLGVEELQGIQALFLGFKAQNSDAVHQVVSSAVTRRINFNSRPQSSKQDDVESPLVAWNLRTNDQDFEWTRKQSQAPNTIWFAPDPSSATELSLESPLLHVGSEAFVLRFEQRYGFESSTDEQGVVTYWDGAVIEVSTDGGTTWKDATEFKVNPGYAGTLTAEGQLPLAGREALVGQSPGFPEWTVTQLNFGTQFARQNVQIRFRSASDNAVGAHGWEIDNLRFSGIENSPFATIESDDSGCRLLPDTGEGEEMTPKKSGGCATTDGTSGFLLGLFLAMTALLRRAYISHRRPLKLPN